VDNLSAACQKFPHENFIVPNQWFGAGFLYFPTILSTEFVQKRCPAAIRGASGQPGPRLPNF
jgi:hypothetical protein